MKIEIEINEEKIKELAKITSLDELPRVIYYEAKRQAVETAVSEIKNKLVEKSYYNGKESLYSEVSSHLYKQIDNNIKEVVENKFSEESIKKIIRYHFDRTFTEWIENKIYKRLEEIKKDIFIGSSGELDAERETEAQAHQDEIRSIEESI